ncbi:MAG: HAMP domain-containing histidine kinase [Clostridia bacterium]|nr:HAMP domain-containing histidine kinase [Clostridia bacterium]
MKLFAKIFICTIAVITAALAVVGYVMISGSFKNAMEHEYENAEAEYQLVKFALQSGMLSGTENGSLTDEALKEAAEQTVSAVQRDTKIMVLSEDGTAVCSTFTGFLNMPGLDDVAEGKVEFHTGAENGSERLYSAGKYTQSGRTVTLILSRDISRLFEEKRSMERSFLRAFAVTELVGALVTLGFSLYITRPINRLTKSTRAFAGGKLDERSNVKSGDEIGELSGSFNSMAETIEETIQKLELSAKQQKDFTSSFAHEIKTPMTSVIGYADMIYQREDMTREETKNAAGYILNEGLRLEALSQKLMELIVLEKQDFTLSEMPADEVMRDIMETMRPAAEAKGIKIECTAQSAYIRIEFDLFKTLMMNLIDNAMKAGSDTVIVSGELCGDKYRVSVTDNGRGIPKDQIERITEAFYMVDKSRSRKAHGAGLGLAIASEIAAIHGAELHFESELGAGTKVGFDLKGAAE